MYIRAYRYELELAIEWYNVFATRIKKFDALALSVEAMYEFLLAGFPGSDDDFTPTYLEHEDIPAARALKTSDLLLYNEDAHYFTKANWLRWREQHIRLRNAYVVMEREEWVDPVTGKTALRPPVLQLALERPKFTVDGYRASVPKTITPPLPPGTYPDDGDDSDASVYSISLFKQFANKKSMNDVRDLYKEFRTPKIQMAMSTLRLPTPSKPDENEPAKGAAEAADKLLEASEGAAAATATPSRRNWATTANASASTTTGGKSDHKNKCKGTTAAAPKAKPQPKSSKRKNTAGETETPSSSKRVKIQADDISNMPDYGTPRQGYTLWHPGMEEDNSLPVKPARGNKVEQARTRPTSRSAVRRTQVAFLVGTHTSRITTSDRSLCLFRKKRCPGRRSGSTGQTFSQLKAAFTTIAGHLDGPTWS